MNWVVIAFQEEDEMFERILYPTDFSEVSNKALGYVERLKDAGAREVVLLHVIDERELQVVEQHSEVPRGIEEGLKRTIEESARKTLGDLDVTLKTSGFEVKLRLEWGIPFREILRVAKEEAVSLVVVGSHGKSSVQEMLLGSVSEKVVRKSEAPVLVVKR